MILQRSYFLWVEIILLSILYLIWFCFQHDHRCFIYWFIQIWEWQWPDTGLHVNLDHKLSPDSLQSLLFSFSEISVYTNAQPARANAKDIGLLHWTDILYEYMVKVSSLTGSRELFSSSAQKHQTPWKCQVSGSLIYLNRIWCLSHSSMTPH